jgi:imidazolonepropionase-like amidohydrolase
VIVNGTVEIFNGRIGYAGTSGGYSIPAGTQVIDVHGQTIMPGIINSHIHDPNAVGSAGLSLTELRRALLLDGITSTCVPGNSLASMADYDLTLTADGLPTGRVFNSGPPITSTGGLLSTDLDRSIRYTVTGAAEATAAVEALVAQGADFIMLSFDTDLTTPATGPRLLNIDELRAIAAAGHGRGLKLRAIVTDAEQLDLALSAGIDVIDHFPAFRDVPTTQAESLDSIFLDNVTVQVVNMNADIQHLAVNTAIIAVPTLNVINTRRPWTRVRQGSEVSIYNEAVARLDSLGGRIALGSAYPLNPTIGMPFPEINALLAAGLTTADIISASTHYAAIACGQEDEIGSLEQGKAADLIVVDGNPLENISALSEVTTVMLGGEIVYAQ